MDNRRSSSAITGERPLTPSARGVLVAGAAATILLFYVAAIVSMAVVGLVLLIVLTVMVGLARVGLGGVATPYMRSQTKLLAIFGRNFWLTTAPTYRITIGPDEAPRLFTILRELAGRMGVETPRDVAIEMHATAWVQLKGYRRGAGRTVLGVGYDLLAALSEPEVAAVLAHELAHAKLVRRGLSRWMSKGLTRLARLTGDLSEHVAACRRDKAPSDPADTMAKAFDALTARAARLVATYSRQDEFDADFAAAEICGAAALRSAFIRFETLDADVGRLPWNERLARLHAGESFSGWLTGELARPDAADVAELPRHAIDPYSTHPSLRDRVAALPPDTAPVGIEQPGIGLLGDPDRVAERLMVEIQRVLDIEERRDSTRLAKATRKYCASAQLRPLHAVALILALVGFGVGIIAIGDGFTAGPTLLAVALLAVAAVLFHRGYHRDSIALPVPKFGTLTNPRPVETHQAFVAAEAALLDELRASVAGIQKTRVRLAALVAESFDALRARDYLRAHVAARLGLACNNKSIDAAMAYTVAAAGLGLAQQSVKTLNWVRASAGLRTFNTKWGAAWALTLLEDPSVEGLLEQLRALDPAQPTFAALLALAQAQRSKPQSAVRSAKRACALDPANTDQVQLLANLLLQAGRARDAAERLQPLETLARTEPHATLLMVRVHLMLNDISAATEWAAHLRTAEGAGRWLVGLGFAFESARADDQAAGFFTDALAVAYYPEAYVGLARIDATRGDRAEARRHLLLALDCDRAVAAGSPPAATLFHQVVARFNALDERRAPCTAWVATFPPDTPLALSGCSVVVWATDRAAAAVHMQTIVSAMHPGRTDVAASTLRWREAPGDQQPVRPVHPGVQRVIA